MAPRIRQDPLEEDLRPRRDAERPKGRQLLRGARPPHQGAFAERSHHHDSEAKLFGEGKDLLFDLALQGVVGDLDRRDPAGPHDLGELAERERAVVRGTDRAHLPFGAQSFEEAELLGPSHQVMDLIELDPPAEIGKRSLGLSAALRSAGGPDLGGNDRTIPSALERTPQHPFGLAVHR